MMKNRYEVRGDETIIFVNYKKSPIQARIDTAHFAVVNAFKGTWRADYFKKLNSFYVSCMDGKKKLYLHRLLMNNPVGLLVDHADGDTLNNRLKNLRLANKSQNAQNLIKLRKNNSSGVRGVRWHKAAGKWMVSIKVNSKDIYLGLFTSLEEAEKVVKEARAKYMPFSKEAMERNSELNGHSL